jgi:Protein of unknown function (DUF3800)
LLIYLDESGDLGFDFNKPKTSKKFVITLLACDNTVTMRHFRKAVRRTLKNKLNHKNARSRIAQELKRTRTSLTIKEYFYRNLPESGWHIYSVILATKVRRDSPPASRGGNVIRSFFSIFFTKPNYLILQS